MENILERLAIKPTTVNKKEEFDIKIGYLDETSKYKNFDINIVKKNLQDIRKIIPEENIETEVVIPETSARKYIKKAKKTTKILKKKITIGEEEIEPQPQPQPQPQPEPEPEPEPEQQPVIPLIETEEEKIEEAPKKIRKSRKTEKVKTGIVVIDSKDWIDVTKEQLPVGKQNVNIRVSSYFMNNREKFINFINTIFNPYRKRFLDEIKNSSINCNTIGSSTGNFELLTHQLLVRDYMNLYTPYRGLLLYFSLGSGKSCTSIAIAEGMKNNKKVIIMTPASLEDNYMGELKKCGDEFYKRNQYWKFNNNPLAFETLSSALNLPYEYIKQQNGAWIVDITKPSNYNNLNSDEKKSLDLQINEMIKSKYEFIHYNGLRRNKLKKMTNNFEVNIFDNSVVIIDEAHNLTSRIVNKIGKEKEIATNKRGEKEKVPLSLSLIIYEMLMSAKNARIVLLTGTPIINYPNEIGILFNILRGYIKTWEIPLELSKSQKINKEYLLEIFSREKSLDYIDYNSSSKKLTITRNPFGFENVKKENIYDGVALKEQEEFNSDSYFERKIIQILKDNNIEVSKQEEIVIKLYKALPDRLDTFVNRFIEPTTGNVKNVELFKKRIIGLTSYYRSAQEKLLPRYNKLTDYHVLHIPMSDYQFSIYESARKEERKMEKSQKKGKVDEKGIYKEPVSTYRIFSRLYCNFVMPLPPGRPLPRETGDLNTNYNDALKQADKEDIDTLVVEDVAVSSSLNINLQEQEDANIVFDEVLEGDAIIEKNADSSYAERIKSALKYITDPENIGSIFSPEGLKIYSPKYLHILENIQDPEYVGLHLVYSQFRTLEGIGLFTIVLEYNGFTQFKIKKNSSGLWELDIKQENKGKPTFALYTGTESKEEKEIIRTIYNGDWDELKNVDPSLLDTLKQTSNNNNLGEIIKVLMITSSGSEGINLRNTRYVHIMEPYWHPIRLEQVIGRARRICSHKNLPEQLQTVNVFVYLMTFSQSQIDSDISIELKLKDVSKREYEVMEKGKSKKKKIPYTSDEALFEISTIKEDINSKLSTAIKEASIDCAIYSTTDSDEKLTCLKFGNPRPTTFSYNPSYEKDETDVISSTNKASLEWEGRVIKIKNKEYIYRQDTQELYDYDSYNEALVNPNIEPILIGSIETKDGKKIVKVKNISYF